MKTEGNWEEVFKDAPVGVYRSSLKGDILYANNTTLQVFGYSDLDEFRAAGTIGTYKNLDDRNAFVAKLKKSGRVNNFEVEVVHKSGTLLTILINAVLNGEEIEGMFMDITGLRQAQEALQEKEKHFKAIYDNASDGILLANAETKQFFNCNDKMIQMLGYSEEEIKGMGVEDIHRAEDLPYIISQFEQLAREEIAFAADVPVKRKDGSIFYADISSVSVVLRGETYLIGLFTDITGRKKAGERLQFFSQITEQVRDVLIVTGLDYKITYVNKAFEDLYG